MQPGPTAAHKRTSSVVRFFLPLTLTGSPAAVVSATRCGRDVYLAPASITSLSPPLDEQLASASWIGGPASSSGRPDQGAANQLAASATVQLSGSVSASWQGRQMTLPARIAVVRVPGPPTGKPGKPCAVVLEPDFGRGTVQLLVYDPDAWRQVAAAEMADTSSLASGCLPRGNDLPLREALQPAANPWLRQSGLSNSRAQGGVGGAALHAAVPNHGNTTPVRGPWSVQAMCGRLHAAVSAAGARVLWSSALGAAAESAARLRPVTWRARLVPQYA
jgi:hypothetical protein